MDAIRLAIADANTLLREGLKRIFSAESDLIVVGEAASEFGILELVERTKPDILLLDLNLPKRGAVPILLQLNQKEVSTRTFILSFFREKERLLDAAKAGACGYALKRTFPETLMQAIKRVHLGEIWVDKHLNCAETFVELARQAQNAAGFNDTFGTLSRREFEVLGLVAKGLGNDAISKQLFISLRTVKVHLYNVYQKLHVDNRTQATLLLLHAYRHEPAMALASDRKVTRNIRPGRPTSNRRGSTEKGDSVKHRHDHLKRPTDASL